MSWRDRAIPVDLPPSGGGSGGWMSRATPVDLPAPAPSETPAQQADAEPSFARKAVGTGLALLNGATFGLAGKATPYAEAGFKNIKDGGDSDAYAAQLAQSQKDWGQIYRTAEHENPVATIAGGLYAPVPELEGAGLAKAAGRVGINAGIGGLVGYDNSAGDTVGERAKDAAIGAGIGTAFAGAGEVASAAPAWLKSVASTRALKAAGYLKSDIKPLVAKGGTDAIQRQGAALLEEGVIPWVGKVDAVKDRIEAALQKHGEKIGSVLQDVDKSGAKFDPGPFVLRAKRELLDPVARDPVMRADSGEVANLLAGYLDAAKDGGMSFSEANAMKGNLQGAVNFNSTTNRQEMMQNLQHIFLDEIDKQVEKVAGPETAAAFKQAKGAYGVLKNADKVAGKAVAGEAGNRILGMSDHQVGTAAAITMGTSGAFLHGGVGGIAGVAGGAALGYGNKIMREYGSSTAARAADAMGSLGQSQMLSKMVQRSPEMFGQFARPLEAAAARGPQELAVAHHVLMANSPAYRDSVRNAAKAAEEGSEP